LSNRIKALGIHPRKSLGQNFLTDERICRHIVDAAQIEPGDLVVEIGPGLGAITTLLAGRGRKLIAIELDQTLIPPLREALAGREQGSIEIMHADALKVDYRQLAGDQPVRFVGNLPYYITSHAIRTLLESQTNWRSIVITVQLEVAQRIVAQPPDMSLLALSVQFYGSAELLFRIPGAAFYPQPNIESATVRITRSPLQSPIDASVFFRIARAAFSQPRKQLRNTLAAGLGISKGMTEDILLQSGISPERRAETVSILEWIRLVQNTQL
jgi:16S rRNA (adenine1518-N6/adenine1519-N6)-dimethyltransferase